MIHRSVVAAYIAVLIVFVTTGSDASASCADEDSQQTADPETAVVVIPGPKKGGTAFLIDTDNRIVLTACHVTDKSPQLEGYFQNGSDKMFDLSVVACGDADVALLKIGEDDSWQLIDREQLRLSFLVPRPQRVAILSTGNTRPTVMTRRSDSFDIDVKPQRTEILISVPVAYSDSGAPVLKDSDGTVFAMVTHRAGSNLARALPIQQLTEFLAEYGAVPIEVDTEFILSLIQDGLSNSPREDGIYWVTGEPIENSTIQFGLHRSDSVTVSKHGNPLHWTVPIEINSGRVDWSSGGLIPIKHHEDFGGTISLSGVTDLEIKEDFSFHSSTRINCSYTTTPDAGIIELDVDVDAAIIERLASEVPRISGDIDQMIEDALNSGSMIRDRQNMWQETRRVVRLPFVRFVPVLSR